MMTVLLLLGCAEGMAQRRVHVVDLETHLPVAGANVTTNGRSLTTDSLGLCSISDSCKTVVVSHVSYESSIVNMKETGDTIFLLSRDLLLPEVVVLGNGKERDYSALTKGLKMNSVEAQLAAANPNGGVSIPLGKIVNAIVPKKWRAGYKKEQRKKKLKEILDNY